MRLTTFLGATLCCLQLTACSKDQPATAAAAEAAGVPSAAAVSSAQAAGNHDTGGVLTAEVSGAKSAHTEIRDIGFCVMNTAGMNIFALSGNNSEWSVSITGMEGLPKVGTYELGKPGAGYTASVTDKTTGTEPVQWQHYETGTGTLTITSATDKLVEGTFTAHGTATIPNATLPPVDAKGQFSSPVGGAC